ncbi:MAG TPA: O-antigen ligase family protein [Terriglobales bacterium]|nr:O-antigen ligase family protein [Terriglobales bacterium]
MTTFSVPQNFASANAGRGGTAEIATWPLVAVLMAAPLAFGAVPSWAWAGMGIAIVVLALSGAVQRVRAGSLTLPWSPLFVPLMVALGLALVQLLAGWSMDAAATRESAMKLAVYALAFFLALLYFSRASARLWRLVALAVTIYAFAVALFAMLQFFARPGLLYGIIKPRWGGYIFGPYVSHNHYAGLMEMLVPLGVGLALTPRPRHPARPLVVFAVLISVVSVLLSGSRGGVIGLLAEFAFLTAAVFCAQPASPERKRALIAGFAVAFLAGASFFWLDPGGVWQRWEQLSESRELTANMRGQVSADTLRMADAHLARGIGLGAFAAAYPAYQTVVTDDLIDYAHNDYAQFVAEGGLAAAVLILISLPLFFRLALRRLRQRLEEPTGWLQLGAAAGVCGILVHSLLDFNLHIPANAAWFAFCAALATLRRNPAPELDCNLP